MARLGSEWRNNRVFYQHNSKTMIMINDCSLALMYHDKYTIPVCASLFLRNLFRAQGRLSEARNFDYGAGLTWNLCPSAVLLLRWYQITNRSQQVHKQTTVNSDQKLNALLFCPWVIQTHPKIGTVGLSRTRHSKVKWSSWPVNKNRKDISAEWSVHPKGSWIPTGFTNDNNLANVN